MESNFIKADINLHRASVESAELIDDAGEIDGVSHHGVPDADEHHIAALEATARYRVLRRVPPFATAMTDWVCDPVEAVLLDIETTGLDPASDQPIELAMVRFRYDRLDGCLLGVVATFSSLNEPSIPIPAVVTRLTGISDADVAGHAIDPVAVAAFMNGVKLVVAHNARFDRSFAEASWPIFNSMPWACSCTGIDWSSRGFEGARLGHLLVQAGFFHVAHRALDDVAATMHLLTLPSPRDGTTAFAEMIASARRPGARIWAEGAPYRHKDLLKKRGYRWSDGTRGMPRAWYRDMAAAFAAEEVQFLRAEVYEAGADGPRIVAVSAYDRYSDRAGIGPS